MKRYSPLRYPGGKGKMYNDVLSIIKKNNLSKIIYGEPFAGGAEIALRLLAEGYASKILINDLDKAIYSFWNSIVNNADEFITLINETKISIIERENQKNIYNNPNSSMLELGFATFYLNRVNRSGIIKAGPISKFEDNVKYPLGCRFNKKDLIERIKYISSVKNKINVTNLDANDFLKKLTKHKKHTFLFIDPPYYVKGGMLYMNSFIHDDHVNLYNSIKRIKKINYVITYDDVDEIKEIYKKFEPIYYQLQYTVEKKRKGNEVMFVSDNLVI